MSSILSTVGPVYTAQLASLLTPLLILKHVASALPPDAFGCYASLLTLALAIQTGIDFGFHYTAARNLAVAASDPQASTNILRAVYSARLLLSALATMAALLALPFFQGPVPRLAPLAILSNALAFALSPSWHLLALRQYLRYAGVEITARTLTIATVLPLLRKLPDPALPLLLQGASFLATHLLVLWMYNRDLLRMSYSSKAAIEAIKANTDSFLYRLGVALFTTANPLVLSFFSSPAHVGFYVAAEKLTRPWLALLDPLNRAYYPKVSISWTRSPAQAVRSAFTLMAASLLLIFPIAATLYFFAPTLAPFIYGPAFAEVATLVRILAFLLPAAAATKALGAHYFLARGNDRLIRRIYLSVGCGTCLLAVPSAMAFGAPALAALAVLAEYTILLWQLVALRSRACSPMPAAAANNRPSTMAYPSSNVPSEAPKRLARASIAEAGRRAAHLTDN